MYKEHLLVLNVLNNNVTMLPTNVTQNDGNTNEITILLRTINDKPFNFTEATSVNVSIVKPNGNLESIQEGDNLVILDREKGKLKVILTDLAVSVSGICQATVDLFNGDDRLTSSRFAYNVVSDIANEVNSELVEESSIGQLITATEHARAEALTAAEAAEEVVSQLGTLYTDTEAAKNAATTAATNANLATQRANTATANTEAAIEGLEEAAAEIESAKSAATAAVSAANEAIGIANTAANNANTAASNAQAIVDSLDSAVEDAITNTTHEDLATQAKTIKGAINENTQQLSGLSDKVVWKPDGWKTEADLPKTYPNNQETIFVSTTSFDGMTSGCIVRTIKSNDFVCKQEIFRTSSEGPVKFRYANALVADEWGEWQQVATVQQIEVLNNDRGYLTSSITADCDTLKYNGMSAFNSASLHKPPWMQYGNILTLSRSDSRYGQIAIETITNNATMGFRNRNNTEGHSEWQQIATTTQVQAMIDAALA